MEIKKGQYKATMTRPETHYKLKVRALAAKMPVIDYLSSVLNAYWRFADGEISAEELQKAIPEFREA